MIRRAAPADLTALAIDAGSRVPTHLGVLLVLSPGTSAADVARVLAERARTVPRLRRRLVPVPPGCGRPVWVDDPSAPAGLVTREEGPPAPQERALLDRATRIVGRPMTVHRPPWRAVVLAAPDGDAAAVVLVLHHVLADGPAGLALLAPLLDGAPEPPPEPAAVLPPRLVLAADALAEHTRAPARLPGAARAARAAGGAAGGLRPEPAAPCALTRGPASPRRSLAVARVDLERLRSGAHRQGGTVNDALLAAVGVALGDHLARRGEALAVLRVAVPVHGAGGPERAGNANAPLVIGVPLGDPSPRLVGRIAARTRAARGRATGPSPATLLGPLFRVAARRGLYRRWLDRQRRFHTVVSNVRGPEHIPVLAGATASSVVPLSIADLGRVGVQVVALSCAGTLVAIVVADAAAVPADEVAAVLQTELERIAGDQVQGPPP